MISLAFIISYPIGSLSMGRISTNGDDFSFSAPKLSAQDTYWPPNSSEWTEVAPEEQGLDSDKIVEMFEFIEENSYDVHSVIIVRNGYLLTEEYLHDFQIYRYIDNSKTYFAGETLHGQYSTTKSVISILIGIALQEGFLDNVSQTLYEFFAHMWNSSFTNSTLKKSITIEQLLTMTSGIGDFIIPNADLKIADDCITFILDEVPLAATPGVVRHYTNEGVDLLSGIITNATGKSTVEFAKEYLFTPLGIEENEYNWLHDDQNFYYGGSGIEITPKVQAKLGMLCLWNGTWNGTQIIDSNYIKSATTDQSIGLISYGYLFYINPPSSSFGGYNSYGAAGQAIYVIPEYDIVVGFTANSDVVPYGQMLTDYILQFTEINAPEGDGNQILGFDFNIIVLLIFCTSALIIIKRKKYSKN
jgi:CubicO group peptidase (beta-lactamase class C family)